LRSISASRRRWKSIIGGASARRRGAGRGPGARGGRRAPARGARVHGAAARGRGVVPAQQVQRAVGHVEQQLVGRVAPTRARLAHGGLGRDEDLAARPARVRVLAVVEGDGVRGPVVPQPARVEGADSGVVQHVHRQARRAGGGVGEGRAHHGAHVGRAHGQQALPAGHLDHRRGPSPLRSRCS
jgi:hypothetical protein